MKSQINSRKGDQTGYYIKKFGSFGIIMSEDVDGGEGECCVSGREGEVGWIC